MDESGIESFAEAFRQLTFDVHQLVGERRQRGELAEAIATHLGTDATDLPVVEQRFPAADHPNVQLALEAIAATSDSRLLGLPVEVLHWSGFGLANLARPGPHTPPFEPVAPAYVNVPIDVDQTLSCVSIGLWLLHHDGVPVVALSSLGDPHRGMNSGVTVAAMSADRDTSTAFLAEVSRLALARNVYRGKTLSFTFDQWGSFGIEFHRLPDVGREDLILPEADLVAIERHTIGIEEAAGQLLSAGRHLKRGLLLYGPPGTGKTFSIMYLCRRMASRTTILLSGQAAPTLGQAAAIARSLQPSMLVLEDVDLVAMERTMPGMGSNPLLFQLLNEMDGLAEDADVIFVLTTNRVELLEPALAARPGRIDQAVEIRLPDTACRRRLLDRYLRGIDLDDVELDEIVARTEGVSAALLKELTRRAVLVAAEGTDPAEAPRVRQQHLVEALDDLLLHSTPVLQRILGADPSEH